jgi:hypothetical protein
MFTGRAEVLLMASDHSPLTRPMANGLMVPERKEVSNPVDSCLFQRHSHFDPGAEDFRLSY